MTAPRLRAVDLAYVAALVDAAAVVRIRRTRDSTELPYVAISTPDLALLTYFADLTGVGAVPTRRQFVKAGCAVHCAERHVHVTSTSGRWSVTGVRATVLLAAVRPYLRFKTATADVALAVGLAAPRKPATLGKMTELGWPAPREWRRTRAVR